MTDEYSLMYIDPDSFLPESTLNVLLAPGMWNMDMDQFYVKLAMLEQKALALIQATINLKRLIEESHDVLVDLCSLYAQSQLMMPLLQVDYMQENGKAALDQFNLILRNIKSVQNSTNISPDENSDQRPGILVFNFNK